MRRTPAIYARGTYELVSPWEIPTPVQAYTCIAIRSFDELSAMGVDAFSDYYEPMGISRDKFELDEAEGATIVTLVSEDQAIYIHVPDTYILSYPDADQVAYSDIVLQVRMTKVPAWLDLGPIEQHLLEYVNAQVGNVNNTVASAVFPRTEKVTVDESVAIENARQANVTDQDTDYVKLQTALAEKQDLQDQVAVLMQILEDNGWAG